MKKFLIYIDGQYLKVDENLLQAFTPGHFKARGVFETLLAVGCKGFDVPAHLRRLGQGARQLQIKGNIPTDKMVQRVINANAFAMARVRILLWVEGKTTHSAVMALPYKPLSKKALKVCAIKTDQKASAIKANLKSLDYQIFVSAFAKAKAHGFDEALLINNKGYIFEASRANIFWVKGNTLYTPPLSSGCLNGITRQAVIDQANRLRIPLKEKNLSVKEFLQAEQAFLTNSLLGIKLILPTPSLPMLK